MEVLGHQGASRVGRECTSVSGDNSIGSTVRSLSVVRAGGLQAFQTAGLPLTSPAREPFRPKQFANRSRRKPQFAKRFCQVLLQRCFRHKPQDVQTTTVCGCTRSTFAYSLNFRQTVLSVTESLPDYWGRPGSQPSTLASEAMQRVAWQEENLS